MKIEDIKKNGLKIINNENQLVFDILKNFNKFSDQFEKKVLKSSITELKKMYFNKELTTLDCCLIHWKQIIKWKKINCITEFCYYEAINQCKLLDKKLNKFTTIEEMPILFGIPYTCKDEESMKGYYSTWGCVVGLKNKCEEDETIIKIMRNNGAIILARGNVPQLLFTCESINNIFGRSLNPHDLERTVGGSSGGDAGLNLIGGSKVSLTKDGAGSTRIPAIFCGLFGFKLSSTRINDKSVKSTSIIIPKYTFITKGPVSRNLDDLIIHLECYLSYSNKKELSKISGKIPFNKQIYLNYKKPEKKLKIGYFTEFKFFSLSKPNKNVLNETIQKMKNFGHDLIDLSELEELFFDCGNKYIQHMYQTNDTKYEYLDGESVIKEYKINKLLTQVPNFLKPFLLKILGLIGEKRIQHASKFTKKATNNEISKYSNETILNYYKFETIFKNKNIDCLLMPGLPFPAMKHSQGEKLAIACVYYLAIFNLLDTSNAIIPIRLVKENEEVYEDNYNKDDLLKLSKECLKNSKNTPISIQIIGLRNEDEKIMGIMHHFDKCREYDLNSLI